MEIESKRIPKFKIAYTAMSLKELLNEISLTDNSSKICKILEIGKSRFNKEFLSKLKTLYLSKCISKECSNKVFTFLKKNMEINIHDHTDF